MSGGKNCQLSAEMMEQLLAQLASPHSQLTVFGLASNCGVPRLPNHVARQPLSIHDMLNEHAAKRSRKRKQIRRRPWEHIAGVPPEIWRQILKLQSVPMSSADFVEGESAYQALFWDDRPTGEGELAVERWKEGRDWLDNFDALAAKVISTRHPACSDRRALRARLVSLLFASSPQPMECVSDPDEKGRLWKVKKLGIPLTSEIRSVCGLPHASLEGQNVVVGQRADPSFVTKDSFTSQLCGAAPESAVPVGDQHSCVSLKEGEANKLAMQMAKEDPGFCQLSCRQWAKRLADRSGKRCSAALVRSTPLWNETMKTTGRSRKVGQRKPKAIPGSQEILERLIAEQANDDEPSSLEESRAKVKVEKLV